MARQSATARAREAYVRGRLRDIAMGANCGEPIGDDDDPLFAQVIAALMCATRRLWSNDRNAYAWGIHCIDRFDTINAAVEHLMEHADLEGSK